VKQRIAVAVMGIVLPLLMGGCTFNAGVNPTYFNYTAHAYPAKIAGKGAVEMSKAEQDEVFTGKPTSFTGGGATLTLPIGGITKEAAHLAFKEVFTEGVKVVDAVPGDQRDFVAIVRPQVTQFSYEYNQLKNLGFAITPGATITLSIKLLDGASNTVWERKFESGNFEGESYMISGSPGEEISKTAHKAMMKLMQEAADAVHQDLSKRAPSPPKVDESL